MEKSNAHKTSFRFLLAVAAKPLNVYTRHESRHILTGRVSQGARKRFWSPKHHFTCNIHHQKFEVLIILKR